MARHTGAMPTIKMQLQHLSFLKAPIIPQMLKKARIPEKISKTNADALSMTL